MSKPQGTSKVRRWRRERAIAWLGLACSLLCLVAWVGSLFGTVGVVWLVSDTPPSSTNWAGMVVPDPAPVQPSVDIRVLAGSICLCRHDRGEMSAIVFEMADDREVFETILGPGNLPTTQAGLRWLSESVGVFWERTPFGVEHRIETVLWLPCAAPSARLSPFAHSGPRFESLIAVPLWIPAVLLAVPALLLLRRARRRRRWVSVGSCSDCGYDLSGLSRAPVKAIAPLADESGLRCPECGKTGRVALPPP